MSYTLELDGIGPVLIKKSSKAKNVNISLRPFKGVRVSVPERIPFRSAEEFIHVKKDWIKKNLIRIRELEEEQRAKQFNLSRIDKNQAKKYLKTRIYQLASFHCFSYNKVFIKNQKTRWGSCSHRNNINLNIQLTLLPQKLIDYVILHELVHTKIKNHSKEFWQELDKYISNSKKIDKEMKKYTIA